MDKNYSIKKVNSGRTIGIMLMMLSVLSTLTMLNHPTVAASDVTQQLQEIQTEAGLNYAVHGVLIGFTTVISLCLSVYAQRIGLGKVTIFFGLICFWLGSFAMIIAALTNGFIVPQLADMYQGGNQQELITFSGLRRFSWSINQNFASFSVVCWSATMVSWGLDLFNRKSAVKVFGLLSLATGVVIAFSILTSFLTLDVVGMTTVIVALGVWQLGIGWRLIRITNQCPETKD